MAYPRGCHGQPFTVHVHPAACWPRRHHVQRISSYVKVETYSVVAYPGRLVNLEKVISLELVCVLKPVNGNSCRTRLNQSFVLPPSLGCIILTENHRLRRVPRRKVSFHIQAKLLKVFNFRFVSTLAWYAVIQVPIAAASFSKLKGVFTCAGSVALHSNI